MKKVSLLITLIILGFSCQNNNQTSSKIADFIPEDSELVIQINLLETFKSAIINNSLLKKTKLLTIIEDNLMSIDSLNISGPLLVCYGPKSDYTFISKRKHILTKTLLRDENSKDSIWIFNSKNPQDKSIKSKQTHPYVKYDAILNKNATFSLYFATKKNKNSLFNNIIINVDTNPNSIAISGIYTDSKWMEIYNGILPKTSNLSEISPSSNFYSFVYSSFDEFYGNIKKLDSSLLMSEFSNTFFNTTKEIGAIKTKFGDAIGIHSIDINSSNEVLSSQQELIKSFRSIPIFKFDQNSIFNSTFGELLPKTDIKFYSVINDFIIFAEKESIIEYIISTFINKNNLSNDQNYIAIKDILSDEVSYSETYSPKALKTVLDEFSISPFSEEELNSYKNTSIQVIKDDNIVHLNGLIQKYSSPNNLQKVKEQFTVKLEAPIIGKIQFVSNHRTKQKDILVQDANNQLYLISNKGTVRWKKKLSSPILGEVQQVDLFKNGCLQISFATQNRIHTIDIFGNYVKNFPIKFNDNISKPLSIFDYDKNKNYRFLVVQNSNLLMFDSNGKRVKGFKYNSSSNILTQPKHIRYRNKDYIAFLKGNRIEILNRRGKTRIPVDEKLNFSNQDLFFNDNMFTTIEDNGDLAQVDIKGRVSKKTLGFKSQTNIFASNKLLVAQWDNILQIGSQKIELEYGNFTPPKLFYLNDKIFITTTDVQSSKVWFFDSKGEVLDDFPVYGTSNVDLDNVDKDLPLEFVCQSNTDELIMYQLY